MIPDIEAVVFDLGGVIVGHDLDYWYGRLAGRCEGSEAEARLRTLLHDHRYSTGQRTIAELHRDLVEDLGYGGGWETFLEDWSCHFTVDEAMLALLERLAANRRVFLFSNTNQEHWEHLVEASGGALGRYRAFLSHEIGLAKPAPEAFRVVVERGGLDPGRSLYIDDRAENVDAARKERFLGEVFTARPAFELRLQEAYGLP
jgi:FMN phosphatase YigB (HAD superfamily)